MRGARTASITPCKPAGIASNTKRGSDRSTPVLVFTGFPVESAGYAPSPALESPAFALSLAQHITHAANAATSALDPRPADTRSLFLIRLAMSADAYRGSTPVGHGDGRCLHFLGMFMLDFPESPLPHESRQPTHYI